MKRLLLIAIVLSGCMSASPKPAPPTLDKECSTKVQAAYQDVHQVEGKVDTLIKLKKDEIEKSAEQVKALHEVTESFDRTRELLERLFTYRDGDGRTKRR